MKRSRLSHSNFAQHFPYRRKIYRLVNVHGSEAAVDARIAGKTVFARKKSYYSGEGSSMKLSTVYEVRFPTEKNWWGTFTANELGVKE